MKFPWQKKPQKKQKVATKTDFKTVLLKPFKDSDSVAKIIMVLVFIVLAAFIFPSEKAIIFSDFVVGSPAPKEVISPVTFTIRKSEQEVQKDRENSQKNILPIFDRLKNVEERAYSQYDTLFAFIRQVRTINSDYWQTKEEAEIFLQKNAESMSDSSLRKSAFLDSLQKEMASDTLKVFFLKNQINERFNLVLDRKWDKIVGRFDIPLETVPKQEFRNFELTLRHLLSVLFDKGVVAFKDEIQEIKVVDDGNVIQKSSQEISSISDKAQFIREKNIELKDNYIKDTELRSVGLNILSNLLKPNLVFNENKTKSEKELVASKVPIYTGFVIKDEKIVDAHEIITQEVKNKLTSLELKIAETNLKAEGYSSFSSFLGQVVIVSFVLGLFLVFLFYYTKKIWYNQKKFSLSLILLFLPILMIYVTDSFFPNEDINYLIPVALSPMLLTMLVGSRIGFVGAIVSAIFVASMNGMDFQLFLTSAITGILSVFLMRQISHRNQIFFTSILLPLVYCLVIWSLHSITFSNLKTNEFVYASINGFLSPILAFGLLYFFEKAFKIITDITLLELSDLNRPILRELSIRAPGTFNHTIGVANLSRAGAEAIGANALLTTVGCYYHDIGKMLKPEYFTENQLDGKNRHDELKPRMSALVITEHVKEGIKMARELKLPQEIIDFIPQHHGTTAIQFFYKKAVEEEGDNVSIDDFRYPGPKPQTKETGIVMIADAAQAATQSIKNPTPQKVKNMIKAITDQKFNSGQFDECDLTLKELTKIQEAFLPIVAGSLHTRIEYPGQEKMLKGEAVNETELRQKDIKITSKEEKKEKDAGQN